MANCCETGKPAPDAYRPAGVITAIGGTSVYLSRQQMMADIPPRGLLLLLPDGFGLAKHNFILADSFAQKGWEVVVPDYFEGDGLPIQLLKRNQNLSIDDEPWPEEDKRQLRYLDFPSWIQRHNHSRISNILSALLDELEVQYKGAPRFGIGYCFGGKHALRLGKRGLQAVAAFHPSFVEAEDLKGIHSPVYVGLAGADSMVPASLHDDLLRWKAGGVKDSVPFDIEVYPDMPHGFAARPESENHIIRAQYSEALHKAVEHLARYSGASET